MAKTPNKRPDDDFDWGKIARNLGIAVIGLMLLLWVANNSLGSGQETDLKYYTELIKLAEKGVVKSIDYYPPMDGQPALIKGEFKEKQTQEFF